MYSHYSKPKNYSRFISHLRLKELSRDKLCQIHAFGVTLHLMVQKIYFNTYNTYCLMFDIDLFFQKDIFHVNVIYVDRTIKIYWPWYHFVVCTWKLFPIDLSCVCSSTSNIYLPVFICRLKSDAASFYTKNRRINNLFIGQHCLNSFILEQKIVCK